jgi:maltose alpha-D-glucosyltransferase/alpha-amylase
VALHGRDAIRTPMQWSRSAGGGFSKAPPDRLVRPMVADAEYGFERVNVTAQRRDRSSLLAWFERMVRTLRECPEAGEGRCSLVEADLPAPVLAHRCDSPTGSVLFLHNLGRETGCAGA